MIRVTPTASTITDDQLDQLYAEIDRLADAVARVRDECDAIEAEVYTDASENAVGHREAVRRIRAALDVPAAPAKEPVGDECPRCDQDTAACLCDLGTPTDD